MYGIKDPLTGNQPDLRRSAARLAAADGDQQRGRRRRRVRSITCTGTAARLRPYRLGAGPSRGRRARQRGDEAVARRPGLHQQRSRGDPVQCRRPQLVQPDRLPHGCGDPRRRELGVPGRFAQRRLQRAGTGSAGGRRQSETDRGASPDRRHQHPQGPEAAGAARRAASGSAGERSPSSEHVGWRDERDAGASRRRLLPPRGGDRRRQRAAPDRRRSGGGRPSRRPPDVPPGRCAGQLRRAVGVAGDGSANAAIAARLGRGTERLGRSADRGSAAVQVVPTPALAEPSAAPWSIARCPNGLGRSLRPRRPRRLRPSRRDAPAPPRTILSRPPPPRRTQREAPMRRSPPRRTTPSALASTRARGRSRTSSRTIPT